MFQVKHAGDFLNGAVALVAIMFLMSPYANAGERFQNYGVQNVDMGQVLSVRPVQIQTQTQSGQWASSAAGAAIGGAVANKLGNGSGRWVATAVGGLLGGIGGQALHAAVSSEEGSEVIVRMDNGRTVAITQVDGDSRLARGQRVMLVGNAGSVRVVPAYDER